MTGLEAALALSPKIFEFLLSHEDGLEPQWTKKIKQLFVDNHVISKCVPPGTTDRHAAMDQDPNLIMSSTLIDKFTEDYTASITKGLNDGKELEDIKYRLCAKGHTVRLWHPNQKGFGRKNI